MSFRVRVKDEQLFYGYVAGNGKVIILPGEYEVDRDSASFEDGKKEDALVFHEANATDGGDLFVRLAEYTDLAQFPDISPAAPIEMPE